LDAETIIDLLGLVPLPEEGGYYRETYRSEESVAVECLPARYGTAKSFCTAIYYLLTAETISAMHRIPSEEIFHFHCGDPVTQLQLLPDGNGKVLTIGTNLAAGQQPQVVVPRHAWQGAMLAPGGNFALMSVTVAPAFDFADFELGPRARLQQFHPDFTDLIERLTDPHRPL
jgi:uncharacterized protein